MNEEELLTIEKHNNTTYTYILKNQDHTIGNLIVEKALKNKNILLASYRIPHPLKKICEIRIQTKFDDPSNIIVDIIKDILNDFKSFEKLFST